MSFTIDLSGQRALVTGAGHGVGRAIAIALGRAGATVAVNDLLPARAQEVAAEVELEGARGIPISFDVTDPLAIREAVDVLKRVDILVNNAGSAGAEQIRFVRFDESDPSDWLPYINVNLFGVMHCTRAVLPGMIERNNGRVIMITSDAARSGQPYMSAYSAAKAGAAGFSRSIAREVGAAGITVNCVALGTIDAAHEPSDSMLDPQEAADLQRLLRGYIVRRRGRPEDVAGLVVYLASPMASWITGQTYPVNGGFTVSQ